MLKLEQGRLNFLFEKRFLAGSMLVLIYQKHVFIPLTRDDSLFHRMLKALEKHVRFSKDLPERKKSLKLSFPV